MWQAKITALGARFLCLVTLLGLQQALAGPMYQDHASIQRAARDYVLQRLVAPQDKIDVVVGALDSRLRLARCDQPLQGFGSPSGKSLGRTTIGVRCRGSKPWKLYVPVQIRKLAPVVVLRNALPRGAVISSDDVIARERDVASLYRGYFSRPEQVVGLRTKRALRADDTLTPSKLVNPLAIKRGALVTIVADSGSLQVRMRGKALRAGSTGDRIRVQNLSSKRELEGIVSGPNEVRVTL